MSERTNLDAMLTYTEQNQSEDVPEIRSRILEYELNQIAPGQPALSQPSVQALSVFHSDIYVHALVHLIADEWMYGQKTTRDQIFGYLVEALGTFEIIRAAEIKRLSDENIQLLMGQPSVIVMPNAPETPEHIKEAV